MVVKKSDAGQGRARGAGSFVKETVREMGEDEAPKIQIFCFGRAYKEKDADVDLEDPRHGREDFKNFSVQCG